MTTPDSFEPVVGYRAWSALDSGYLASTNSHLRPWVPGKNEAVCYNTPAHRAAKASQGSYPSPVPPQTVYKNVNGALEEVPYTTHDLIPDPACGCGFWFLKSVDDVVQMFSYSLWLGDGVYAGYGPRNCVVGTVKGWGRSILAANGYRSEFAEITGILVASEAEDFARHQHIADLYGVPLEKSDALNRPPEGEGPSDLYSTLTAHSITGSGLYTPPTSRIKKLLGGGA